jgi:hypothetical protein
MYPRPRRARGATARAWVAIAGRDPPDLGAGRSGCPAQLAHPVLLVGQAVLFVFFLHYPFLLAVRNAFGGSSNSTGRWARCRPLPQA